MVGHPLLAKGFAVLSVLLLIATAYLYLCRPYQLHWGATVAEIERPMPGDELNTNPSFLATRAITIDASPEEVWPWLSLGARLRLPIYDAALVLAMGRTRCIRNIHSVTS